jgi:hypothetical protein
VHRQTENTKHKKRALGAQWQVTWGVVPLGCKQPRLLCFVCLPVGRGLVLYTVHQANFASLILGAQCSNVLLLFFNNNSGLRSEYCPENARLISGFARG